MPLIRAISRFFKRRMDVGYSSADYGDAIRAEGRGDLGGFGSVGGEGLVWLVIMLAAVPLILFLIFIGLLYEVILHLGGRRLPVALDWLIATVAVSLAVGGGIWWILQR